MALPDVPVNIQRIAEIYDISIDTARAWRYSRRLPTHIPGTKVWWLSEVEAAIQHAAETAPRYMGRYSRKIPNRIRPNDVPATNKQIAQRYGVTVSGVLWWGSNGWLPPYIDGAGFVRWMGEVERALADHDGGKPQFSADEVKTIRHRYFAEHHTQVTIAGDYCVSPSTISLVVNGNRSYRNVAL